MNKEWKPDTCDCSIVLDDATYKLVSWNRRCALHQQVDDQALLDAVMTHCRTYSSRITDTSTKADILQNQKDKQAEQKRILALGTTETK